EGEATLTVEVAAAGKYTAAKATAKVTVVAGSSAPSEPTVITLTAEGLPTSYPAEGTVQSWGGKSFSLYNVAYFKDYNSDIQMKKGGSFLYNTESLGKIKSVKLNVQSGKKWYDSNVKLYAGNALNPTEEVPLKSSDETGSVYEITGNCDYIKLSNPSSYTVNMSSIEITVE
ncbi:MAG: hypothetical protein MSA53_00070, partial [Bacteroidales bacterium]|nr:hypothetical protein [Bacteroidales bacterium]